MSRSECAAERRDPALLACEGATGARAERGCRGVPSGTRGVVLVNSVISALPKLPARRPSVVPRALSG